MLGVCLGHQVLAQGLEGLVQPRTHPGRHYALQESELVCRLPAGSSTATTARDTISDAVAAVRREKERGGGGGGGGDGGKDGVGDGETAFVLPPPPPLKLLYHHNDEV